MAADPSDHPPFRETSPSSFPATQWTLVGTAAAEATAGGRPALSGLLARYLPALRSHLVTRQRIAEEEADDLLQGFVTAKVLEQNLMGRADAGRGKFRSFLLISLDRYVVDERRRRATLTRGESGRAADEVDAPSPLPAPSRAFEVEWARQILDEAVRRMRLDCEQRGRPDLWGAFEERVLRPAREAVEPLDYETLVARYGLNSPAQASNVLITAKRMFARHLRAIVGEYAATPADVDDELRDLWRAVRPD